MIFNEHVLRYLGSFEVLIDASAMRGEPNEHIIAFYYFLWDGEF